uniref:Uncharacterized protein n=1 Tax=Arundo donax TaxID=35708 RepID=A0A0A9GUK1_ARUDO
MSIMKTATCVFRSMLASSVSKDITNLSYK